MSSSLFNFVLSEFTRLRKIKSTPKNNNHPTSSKEMKNFSNISIKLISFVIFLIFFLIFVNMFTRNRNECCIDFMDSILEDTNHAKHIIKQLCLTVICFYIFYYSHLKFKFIVDITFVLIDYLFDEKDLDLNKTKLELKLNEINNDFYDNDDTLISSSLEVLTVNPRRNQTSARIYFFDKTINEFVLNKNRVFTLLIFLAVSSLQLSLLSLSDLIYLWSISFLIINLIIISIVLLFNYFPYQVLMDVNSSSRGSRFIFRTREEAPLIRQQQNKGMKPMKPIYKNSNEATETQEEEDIDGTEIDTAFNQFKQELKTKALSNKSLSFGSNQPSMNSAYRAICAYITFILISVISSLYLNYLKSDQFDIRKLNGIKLALFILFTFILFMFKSLISYLFLIRNLKETIYITNLYYKSPYLPYSHLILSFLSIYFILNLNHFILIVFICQLVFYLIILLVIYNVWIRIKKKGSESYFIDRNRLNAEWTLNAINGTNDSIRVFTIDPSNEK